MAEQDKDKPQGVFIHFLDKPDACDHDFSGWREWPTGGEQVCTKCGIGAMHYSLMKD
jgi:hypothetical protein